MSEHGGTSFAAQSPDPARIDMREYSTERVVQAVGARWNPPVTGDWLMIVLSPSFHPDLVITMHRTQGRSRIMAHTAGCNLWYLHLSTLEPDEHPMRRRTEPPRPEPAWEAASSEGDQADDLWQWASAVLAMPEPGQSQTCLDGMLVTIRARVGADFGQLETSSPEQGPARMLLEAVFAVAESLGDQRIVKIAEQAHAYL